MVHFVGAGPGSPDLITVRGKQYLATAMHVQLSRPPESKTTAFSFSIIYAPSI